MGGSSTTENELNISEELKSFKQRKPDFLVLKDALEALLREGLESLGISGGMVTNGRLKTPKSIVGKLRSRAKHPEYKKATTRLDVFTDLVGVRVLLPITVDRKRMEAWLRDQAQGLWIDPVDYRTDGEVLEPDEFGYRSEHIIVTLDPTSSRWNSVPPKVLERLNVKSDSTGRPIGRAEIQLRTFAAHAWAIHAHDQFYKSEGGRPDELKRASSKAAALLEAADDELSRVAWEVAAFESPVLSVRRPALALQELEDLEALLAVAEGGEQEALLLRRARLFRLLGRWDEALEALEKCAPEDVDAACERATLYALRASENTSPNENSFTSVAKVLNEIQPITCDHYCDFAEACLLFRGEWTHDAGNPARAYSEKALRLDSRSPRAFRNYVIACMLDATDPGETVRSLTPQLLVAAELSSARAEQAVYVPWGCFDSALFSFLVTTFSDRAGNAAVGPPDKDLVACYDDLLLGIELWRRAAEPGSSDKKTAGHRTAIYPLVVYHRFLEVLLPRLKGVHANQLGSMRDILTLAIHAHSAGTPPGRADLKAIVPLTPPGIPAKQAGQRLVIVAGTCNEQLGQSLRWYQDQLPSAFENYDGVLVSGGTNAGISGIAQTLGTTGKLLRRGYLGKNRQYAELDWESPDDCVGVRGEESTPCEVLAYWRDAMLAGFNPGGTERDCLLLGVDGGVVSAFEYKLAIALGAPAGIFNDPELAAARGGTYVSAWKALNNSPVWCSSTNFIPLPKDPYIAHVFLRMPATTWVSESVPRERLAEQTHNSYRDVVARYLKVMDDYYKDWCDLNDDAKKSNFDQVDALPHILERAGLFLVPWEDGEKLLATGEYEATEEASKGEIELIARLEHARWCVERLSAGWRYGPVRDNVNKLRPQLVSWEELAKLRGGVDAAEMEKDRAVARGVTNVVIRLSENGLRYMLLRKLGER